jgi:CubicO group peptidase (beta-lactamase class C family)
VFLALELSLYKSNSIIMLAHRIVLLIALSHLISTQSSHETLDHFVDKQVNRAMKRHHLPAFAITIVENQNTIYEKATGYADLERAMKVSSASVFKLWSVAKAFTAIEIFKEVEEGLIDLDDPLIKYLPEFKIKNEFGDQDQVTIRSLLAHQSGMPRNECLKVPAGENQYGTLNRFEIGTWDCFKATPTGSRYKYSNLGYDLLGRVIEENRQSGFTGYMQNEVLISLGMENAAFNSEYILDKERLVLGYEYHKRKYYPMIQHDINSVPSGNLYASLDDLTNFMKSVFRGDPFRNDSTLSKMYQSHYDTRSNPETMGLGWKTSKFRDSELLVWHDGGPGEGIGALIAFLPDRELGIAMMANSTSFGGIQSIQLATRILEEIIEEGDQKEENIHSELPTPTIRNEILQSYEGNYIAWGSIMKVKAKRNKLKGKIGGFGLDLIPLKDDEFRVSSWMDRVGLTKIIRPPMDIKKLSISFPPPGTSGSGSMIINMNYFNHEICPRYPDALRLPDKMQGIAGNYDMAWRLPNDKPGPLSGSTYSITFDDGVLKMSGVFGPILPLDEQNLKILSGPFAGEIMEYDHANGRILHQNGIFIPQI